MATKKSTSSYKDKGRIIGRKRAPSHVKKNGQAERHWGEWERVIGTKRADSAKKYFSPADKAYDRGRVIGYKRKKKNFL